MIIKMAIQFEDPAELHYILRCNDFGRTTFI